MDMMWIILLLECKIKIKFGNDIYVPTAHHRLAALKILNQKEVSAIVVDYTDPQQLNNATQKRMRLGWLCQIIFHQGEAYKAMSIKYPNLIKEGWDHIMSKES